MKHIISNINLFLFSGLAFFTLEVSAGSPLESGLEAFEASESGLRDDTSIIGYIGTIIGWLLGLVGLIFFVLIVVNGLKYMTASGDASKTKEAISGLSNAIIGLVIVMASFLITQYVASAVLGG